MNTLKIRWILGLALALPVAPALHAGTVYTYTGNDFTYFNSPYTGSDFVSVSVTLSTPLPYSSAFTYYTPTAFSFSDGVDTLDDTTPNINNDQFGFETDNGAITVWFDYIWIGVGELPAITTCRDFLSCGGLTVDQGQSLTTFANNQQDPGTWQGEIQAAPEPFSGLTSLTGVLLIAGTLFYRRRRSAVPRIL